MSFGSFKMPTLQKMEIIKSAGRKLAGLDGLTLPARRLEELPFPSQGCLRAHSIRSSSSSPRRCSQAFSVYRTVSSADLRSWDPVESERKISLSWESVPQLRPGGVWWYTRHIYIYMSGLPGAGRGVGWNLEEKQTSCMKLGHLELMSSSMCWGPVTRILWTTSI